MSVRRLPYTRSKRPSPLKLTPRDVRILETIHSFDGMLSLKQIDHMFFSGKGRSQPRTRMRKLFDNGYVNTPNRQSIHQIPYGETIFWLDRKGASVVAALQGQELSQFTWRKKPRLSLVAHDLKINDFRIALTEAVIDHPNLRLKSWIPEGEFLAQPDTIHYLSKQGTKKRQIRPDGFFTIEADNLKYPFAFLLEIDMSTEDNPRFVREKVIPGKAYIKSAAYQERFGLRYGRYLVVTTGTRRFHSLKEQTERAGGTGLFYFSTFDKMQVKDILSQPIWWMAGEQAPQSMLPPQVFTT